MYIQRIQIRNFRLLRDVRLSLEKRTTVIVGRNNSGKTSLTEVFRRLLQENAPSFQLEDFSLAAHEDFWKSFLLHHDAHQESEVRAVLPTIEVTLVVAYDKTAPNLGALGDFVIDLNEKCSEALIVIRYQLKDGEIGAFFENISYDPAAAENEQRRAFFRAIKDRIKPRYAASVVAVDPNDPTNQKTLEFSKLRALVQSGFINAQRGLDDITHTDKDVLGKILEALFKSAMSDTADPGDRAIAKALEDSVRSIQDSIGGGFSKQLEDLFPAFEIFGYPGLSDPRLLTETTLDVKRLLTDHTKVHYAGVNGINLPEAYNGLGVRNLIFILLKLLEYFKAFKAVPTASGIHLVFIEEPEVHLHPQMQEVFISKLAAIADVFAKRFNGGVPWPVQFVVSTHSSHLANKAPFDSMRYFLATSDDHASHIRSTQIKDLRDGLGGTLPEVQDFLHKYMTLTRCDLLFADKAVLIEGMTERILLPQMIKKVDGKMPAGHPLSSQYVSVVEVGGAYAHLFFGLLDFLELRTLVITDLDAVKKNDQNKLVACKVSEGTSTSNACIKEWFAGKDVSPAELVKKSDEDRTSGSGIRRLAYQMPENGNAPCGRSFEDAFILANPTLFALSNVTEEEACEKAERVDKKSDFAIEYAIQKTDWTVPRYIDEGLRWLREGHRSPSGTSGPQSPSPADPTPAPAEAPHA